MNTITFDTHKIIQKLQARGFTKDQAEGVVEVISESILVTPDYLDKRLAETQTSLIKWVAGMLVAQAATIVALLQLVG